MNRLLHGEPKRADPQLTSVSKLKTCGLRLQPGWQQPMRLLLLLPVHLASSNSLFNKERWPEATLQHLFL